MHYRIESYVTYILDHLHTDTSKEDLDILIRARDENLEFVFSEYLQNKDKLLAVHKMFANEDSAITFEREIIFKILQKTFGPLFAVAHTDGMSFEHIDSYDSIVAQKLADGSLPNLYSSNDRALYQFLKTTYIFEQYKYPPHIFISPGDIVLDCGACFGDVALWAMQCGASKVFAFEPDPANFSLLERNMLKFASEKPIVPIKLAFGVKEGSMRFTSNISSSRFMDDGEISVPVSTLDAWCQDRQILPDFIKMDIEGAEADALIGSRETIAKLKPRLAISIYHNFSDLWEIPLALKAYNPVYNFYCKKHHPIHECILYAISK